MLIRPTNVAATSCHVLSPVFTQLGYGTETTAPSTVRVLLSYGQTRVPAPRAMERAYATPGTPSHVRPVRPAVERMQPGSFGTVTRVLPARELEERPRCRPGGATWARATESLERRTTPARARPPPARPALSRLSAGSRASVATVWAVRSAACSACWIEAVASPARRRALAVGRRCAT